MSIENKPRRSIIISIFIGLGIWLIALFVTLSWFQNQYIKSFTDHNPNFLNVSFTDLWFETLLTHLPAKKSKARIIQLWKPDCLCNRFARPHSLAAVELTKALGYEHITIIPAEYESRISSFQALNPDTQMMVIDSSLLDTWPSAPSVLIEGSFNQLVYIGPLGFGTFCNQATTSAIETQLTGIANNQVRPFYNLVGKGCFCNWE
ncbi:hypothetical protein NBRC116188_02770 [Oceaniserpentilla sp. 4NH20-0058]|uniref:DUF6436 domain-containing protein n=1 Tax=Oceaniserpentilla sp. 4NH20-0058 TaxID=3127660 RepID=UPI0031057ACA